MCCGGGANLFYMGKKYKDHKFYGVEVNESLANTANYLLKENLDNQDIKVYCDDLYRLKGDYAPAGGYPFSNTAYVD